MSLPKEIKSTDWVKNWSGNWRLGFASLYGVYTTKLKPIAGKNLQVTLLVCEKEASSNYIAKQDMDGYGKHIASLVIKNPKLSEQWAKDTLKTAGVLFAAVTAINKTKSFTAANLLDLQRKFYLHIPPHFSIKKLADYLPEDLRKKLMPRLREVRVKTENLFNEVDDCLRRYTRRIAKQEPYSERLTEFLTVPEIALYLQDKILPPQKELQRRCNGTAILFRGRISTSFVGDDFRNLLKVLVNESATELKGVAAYLGKAKGVVRVVFDPRKVKIFNIGDVLVTGMTRPEFLPLMKKASAFVTDAGGMLSHAAIVARELKKPCILSTETATKVFKDGDRVEVDAEKGVVRKL